MEIRTNAPLLAALKKSTAWRTYDHEGDRLSHAYLLLSEDKTAAEELVRLMCARAYCQTVCLTCPECRKVLDRVKPDVVEPNPAGEILAVEKVQPIIEDATMGSIEGGRKIYVIRNMHLQRERVQNLLLKTLEEPNDNVTFILTASGEKGILPTVLSRVKSLPLAPFSVAETIAVLEAEGIETSEIFAKASMGNLTLAYELSTDEAYFAVVDEVVDLLAELKRTADIPQWLYRDIFDKDCINRTLDVLEIAVKDLTFVKSGIEEYVVYRNKLSIYRQIAGAYPVRSLPMILDVINESKLRVASFCTAVNVADNLLLGLLEVKSICAQ